MNKYRIALAVAAALSTAPAFATPQRMDPNMAGMASMQRDARPADAQGVGVTPTVGLAM